MKKWLAMILCLIMVLSMVACSGPGSAEDTTPEEPTDSKPSTSAVEEPEEEVTSEPDDEIVIALIPQQLGNPANLDAKKGAEEAAAELGFTLEFQSTNTADVAQQVTLVESMIASGVDGIAIAVNSAEGLQAVIDEAVAKGIKVCTFDSDSPASQRLFYVGAKNYNMGYMCGQRLVELTGGKGKVAALTGMLGAVDLEDRIQGFRDGIADSDLELVTVLTGNDDIDKSIEVVEEYTAANPDLDAWFMAGPWTYYSPPESLPELVSWKNASPDHHIVTVDFFYPTADYFEAGILDYAVGQSVYNMGYYSVKSLYQAIIGEEVETEETANGKFVDTGLTEVTPDNWEEVKAGLNPW